MTFGRLRGDQQSLAAKVNGFSGRLFRKFEVNKRHVPGAEEASIDRTEIDHHAVVGLGCRVGEFGRSALIEAEIAETPGREDQLTGKTEIVERLRPVLLAKR